MIVEYSQCRSFTLSYPCYGHTLHSLCLAWCLAYKWHPKVSNQIWGWVQSELELHPWHGNSTPLRCKVRQQHPGLSFLARVWTVSSQDQYRITLWCLYGVMYSGMPKSCNSGYAFYSFLWRDIAHCHSVLTGPKLCLKKSYQNTCQV